jgi:hypothetical protein
MTSPASLVGDVLNHSLRPGHCLLGGIVPEQRPGVADRGRAVGEGVVDPPHQSALILFELDHVHLPQRPAAIQALFKQPGNARQQPLGADRSLMAMLDDVAREVEVGVCCPSGRG